MSGVLISVTQVRITPDLGIAHAHLSFFPSEKANELLANINDNIKQIRF
jgi:ribosome-binding factor A